MSIWRKSQDVKIQHQTTEPFKYTFINHLNENITLTSPITINDTIANISAGHGFVIGDDFIIWEGGRFNQTLVTNVVANAITVASPFDMSFINPDIIIRGNRQMNVNGSIAPINFRFVAYNPYQPIDIMNFQVIIQSGTSVPDDGKFGGIAALTNGVFIRKTDGTNKNMGTFKTNADFKNYGGIVTYTTKAPAGTNSTEIILKMQEMYGLVIRIGYLSDEEIIIKIRDNLTTLSNFTVSAIGHYTEGEK